MTVQVSKSGDVAMGTLMPPEFVENAYHILPTLMIEGSGKLEAMAGLMAGLDSF